MSILNRARQRIFDLTLTASTAVSLACALCGCQSPAYKSFDQVHVGMDKASIVESVGSPTKSMRWHGMDRWIYEFGDHPGGTQVREVHFEAGRAIYVGPKVSSTVSAAEQDRLNAEAVKSESESMEVVEEQRTLSLGAHRPSRSATRNSEDALDQRFRESFYGVDPDPSRERLKRAPVFVPVQ
jgi:outer membrane protein assembly factor BamE (lipoprotein component of BamABCDE complex)